MNMNWTNGLEIHPIHVQLLADSLTQHGTLLPGEPARTVPSPLPECASNVERPYILLGVLLVQYICPGYVSEHSLVTGNLQYSSSIEDPSVA